MKGRIVECTGCGELLFQSPNNFHRQSRVRSGFYAQCKSCITKMNVAWRKNNPDKAKLIHNRAHAKARNARTPDAVERDNQYLRDWYKKNRPQARERQLKKTYGITLAEFEDMRAAQSDTCAICGTSERGRRDWNVDHDHTTGAVRGLLCEQCNFGLGQFRDNPELLEKAALYIKGA
jgi:hypothetical protein